jgi:hypothetical protein
MLLNDGKPFLSKAEAAARLGVTPRTIQTYRELGYLRTAPGGLRKGVIRRDVEFLVRFGVPRSRPSDSLERRLLARRLLDLEVRSLALAELLDARRVPLDLDRAGLCQLNDRAARVAVDGWEHGSEGEWLRILCRLDQRHARRLARARPGSNPWACFLVLAELLAFVLDEAGPPTSLDHDKLDGPRQAAVLRQLSLMVMDHIRAMLARWTAKQGTLALRKALREFERTRQAPGAPSC